MKIFNLVFSVLFFLCAALQYNDPDFYILILIYLCGGLFCWLVYLGRFFPKYYLPAMIVYSLYALKIFFKNNGVMDWLTVYNAESLLQDMKATKPWIESAREFIGLLLLIIVFSINYLKAPRKKVNYYGESGLENAKPL